MIFSGEKDAIARINDAIVGGSCRHYDVDVDAFLPLRLVHYSRIIHDKIHPAINLPRPSEHLCNTKMAEACVLYTRTPIGPENAM